MLLIYCLILKFCTVIADKFEKRKSCALFLISYGPVSYTQAGDSTPEELANATQVQGSYLPIVREKPAVELVKITDEMKAFKAYYKLRLERTNKRHLGARLKRAAEAEKEDKK